MTFKLETLRLRGDTPGTVVELPFYRIGPSDAPEKVYLQAALHADEQPGTMLLHRTPYFPHSSARFRIMLSMPAFAAPTCT